MNEERHFLTPDPDSPPAPGAPSPSLKADASVSSDSPEDRRRRPRFEVSVRVHLTIFAELSATPEADRRERSRMRLVREGFSKDLSVSGVCVVLDDRVTGVPLQQLVGNKAKLRLEWNEPESEGLQILGEVAWGREKDGVVKLGIQFTDVPAGTREKLEQLCQKDESELNRISNLWELLVAEPRNPSS